MVDFTADLDWAMRFANKEDFEDFVRLLSHRYGQRNVQAADVQAPIYSRDDSSGMADLLRKTPAERSRVHFSCEIGGEMRIYLTMRRSGAHEPAVRIAGTLIEQGQSSMHWQHVLEDFTGFARPLTRWGRYITQPLVTDESRETYIKTKREWIVRVQSWLFGIAGGVIGAFIVHLLGLKAPA
ncbi:hypothetical protein NG696_14805 [Pseudarthrobacter sp. HLT1-5]|nr:hypothetical protein [Pseudarthrobacter sp. HLT1-5]